MQSGHTNETMEVDEGARVYSFFIVTNAETLPITVACQSNDRHAISCKLMGMRMYATCARMFGLQCGVIVMWRRACIARWRVED